MNLNIELKEFQRELVDFLMDKTLNLENHRKEILTIQAPTGSGKTIILINYIKEYLDLNQNVVFVWLTPGKGKLEEQSKNKLKKYFPKIAAYTLTDLLDSGFKTNSVYFINWEKITKKGNIATETNEHKNVYDLMQDAKSKNTKFIVIIDEEHLNATLKSNLFLEKLNPNYEIRVSATPFTKTPTYKVSDFEVIESGLITKNIEINQNFKNENILNTDFASQNKILISYAIELRNQIQKEYEKLGKSINPLVLIQFPNVNDELIDNTINFLAEKGYTTENFDENQSAEVALWFSRTDLKDEPRRSSNWLQKLNLEGITKNDSKVKFLLFKEAIATGWDCPRAKILVKLRENMNDIFETQTIGRIRRMPEGHHYSIPILDNCYLLTFDSRYNQETITDKVSLKSLILNLKDEPKEWKFQKMVTNRESTTDDTKIRKFLYLFIKRKFNLNNNFDENIQKLKSHGFIFIGEFLTSKYFYGTKKQLSEVNEKKLNEEQINIPINTHEIGFDYKQTINSFRKYIGLDNYYQTSILLQSYFLSKIESKYKILNFATTKEYWGFILNNKKLLTELFKNFFQSTGNELDDENTQKFEQLEFLTTKIIPIKLQDPEIYYEADKPRNRIKILNKNVYFKYTDAIVNLNTQNKPLSEELFEKYCEKDSNVQFVYKNKDSGPNYLSIVLYVSSGTKTRLFYPDYIVKANNNFYIIEAKGGENNDVEQRDTNIDPLVKIKFDALKQYSFEYGYKFAFVRYQGNKLFFNNSTYVEDMNDFEHWLPIELLFKNE